MSKVSTHQNVTWKGERQNGKKYDKVRNNNVTRAPDQLHHHKHSFFIFAFSRCSIKTHKYFLMSRETFSGAPQKPLVQSWRKQNTFISRKIRKSRGKSFEYERKWLFEMLERRGEAWSVRMGMKCESWKYYESDVVFFWLYTFLDYFITIFIRGVIDKWNRECVGATEWEKLMKK